MLFDNYKSLYITEDNKEIRTGPSFIYCLFKGKLLKDVDIEETEHEIKIHGWLQTYKSHNNNNGWMDMYIPDEDWDKYCINESDFEDIFPILGGKMFGTKKRTILKDGSYVLKKCEEILITFARENMPMEIYSR